MQECFGLTYVLHFLTCLGVSLFAQAADAEDQDAAAEEAEQQRGYAIEQLTASVRFPAASDADRMQVLRFLAAHAFFVPGAPAAVVITAVTPSKKGKKGGAAAAVAVPELEAAASCQQPISQGTRAVCAQRLVLLFGHIAILQNQQVYAAHKQGTVQESDKPVEQGKKKKQKKVRWAGLRYSRSAAVAAAAAAALRIRVVALAMDSPHVLLAHGQGVSLDTLLPFLSSETTAKRPRPKLIDALNQEHCQSTQNVVSRPPCSVTHLFRMRKWNWLQLQPRHALTAQPTSSRV